MAWPQSLWGCHNIGVLKSKLGHSLRDAKVLGLSPSDEHTPQEKETERKLGSPPLCSLRLIPTLSRPQPSSETFSNPNTPRWPRFLCLSGLFSCMKSPRLWAGPPKPAVADGGHGLGTAEALGAAPASLHHELRLVSPSGWPCLLHLLPAFF